MLDHQPDDIDADLYRQAAALVVKEQKVSTSFIQRKLGIGYNKAARIIEKLEADGYVSAADHVGKRTVATAEDLKSVVTLSQLLTDQGESRMKETDEDRKVRRDVEAVGVERLRSFVERVERLEEEKQEVADQIKEVFAEIKGEGYDTKAIRAIIRRRKQDPDKLAEHEAVLDLYLSALGMS